MSRALKLIVAAALMCGVATPSTAAKLITAPVLTNVGCSNGDINASVVACSGFYAGNLNGGSSQDLFSIQTGLNAIAAYQGLITSAGTNLTITGGNTINFGSAVTGIEFVGLHFGNGEGGPSHSYPGGTTAFYEINATNLTSFTTHFTDLSNAVLYPGTAAAVPEPATWAMMLFGFAGIGASMRRRRKVALTQIA